MDNGNDEWKAICGTVATLCSTFRDTSPLLLVLALFWHIP